MDLGDELLDELFSALGAHLERADCQIALVVVGGANLAVSGRVIRTTKDVDVIAQATWEGERVRLTRAEPFPEPLAQAIKRVARDYGLHENWLNCVIEKQWDTGLPPEFEEDITWHEYSALTIGLAGRRSLVLLKFFAALDQGADSVHWQDLLTLAPTAEEIDQAVAWVRGQDAGHEFQSFIEEASGRLRRALDERP